MTALAAQRVLLTAESPTAGVTFELPAGFEARRLVVSMERHGGASEWSVVVPTVGPTAPREHPGRAVFVSFEAYPEDDAQPTDRVVVTVTLADDYIDGGT